MFILLFGVHDGARRAFDLFQTPTTNQKAIRPGYLLS
jgi:hypothetical protein